jgi:sugar phosphate permease
MEALLFHNTERMQKMGNRHASWLKTPFFYGWIITALGFLALVASMGLRTSYGAFVTPWENDFGITRSDVGLISAVGLIFYGIFLPVAGNLADKIGARTVFSVSLALMGVSLVILYFAQDVWLLYLLYGVTASIGFAGASNVTASAAIVHWFHEKRGFVLGLMVTGMAFGQMVMVPISIYLIRTFDWRFTMLLYGVIYLLLTPVMILFFRNRPGDIGEKPYGVQTAAAAAASKNSEKISMLDIVTQIYRHPVTWLFIFMQFICGFTDVGLIHTHMVPLAEGRMFSDTLISVVTSMYAFVNIIATLFIGYLADRVNLVRLLTVIYLIRAGGITLLFFAHDPVLFVLFGIFGGITDFASIAPMTALCSKLFGAARVGTVFGMLSLFHQFGASAGSYVPGVLYDWTGSYSGALLLCIGLLVAVALSVLFIKENQEIEIKAQRGKTHLSA